MVGKALCVYVCVCVAGHGQELYEKSLYLLLNFVMNLKLL